MQRYEYKVIPAPKRGDRARGVKTTEDRFAHALTMVMNALGAEGWDYVRSDTLPCDERAGFTGTKTTFQNMLVFRRPLLAPGGEQPDLLTLRVMQPDAMATPRLGPADMPVGAAPAVGPAKTSLAAE